MADRPKDLARDLDASLRHLGTDPPPKPPTGIARPENPVSRGQESADGRIHITLYTNLTKLELAEGPSMGRYVKSRYGPGTSFTEVRAHPLHIFASGDLTGLQIDPSKDGVVVDDVPHSIADLLESDVLTLERITQEVLT